MKRGISFGILNSRSVKNKEHLVTDYMLEYNHDVIALTETWLSNVHGENDISISRLCMNGSNCFIHEPRPTRGGGVGILYASHCGASQVALDTTYTTFECVASRLKIDALSIYVYVVYRPPPNQINGFTFARFIEEFSEFLNGVNTSFSACPIYIVGDLNIHFDKNSAESTCVLNLLQGYNMTQLVTEPTHSAGHTLDCVITHIDSPLNADISTVYIDFSDHWAINIDFRDLDVGRLSARRKHRNLCNIDMLSFQTDLENYIDDSFHDDGLNQLVELYNGGLSLILDKHAPVRYRRCQVQRDNPWINDDILCAKRLRRGLERKWRKVKSSPGADSDLISKSLQDYREKCRYVSCLITKAKEEYYTNRVMEAVTDTRRLFKVTKTMMGLAQPTPLPNNDAKSDTEIADDFASYFRSKISGLRAEIDSQQLHLAADSTSSADGSSRLVCSLESFRLTDTEEVAKVINALSDATCDLDPLPTRFVKIFSSSMLTAITAIVNSSLSSGCFPQALKSSIITPLLKKTNAETVLGNYRPISNLSFLSKVIERVVMQRVTEHMEACGTGDVFQSAYTAGRSTETALLRVHSDLSQCLDDKRMSVVALLDLSSAFDTVDHCLLLERLRTDYGIRGSALCWFQSYLSERSYRVKVNDSMSGIVTLDWGVPQGSILGPILFKMYLAPLGRVIDHFDIKRHFYADDAQIYCSFDPYDPMSKDTAILNLENCISHVTSWLTRNYLKCNTSKTEVFLAGSKHNLSYLPLVNVKIGNCYVSSVASVKNLGVVFDNVLTMHNFITCKIQACNMFLKKISLIRKYLTPEATQILVNSYITSRLDYANSLLFGLPNYEIHRLQLVQNACARLILGYTRSQHITPALYSLHWLPVESRIIFKIALLVYKCFNMDGPHYLDELLEVYVPSRDLRSINDNVLVVPRFYSRYGTYTFNHKSAFVWNFLPLYVKESPSLPVFKTRLKTFLFQKYYFS